MDFCQIAMHVFVVVVVVCAVDPVLDERETRLGGVRAGTVGLAVILVLAVVHRLVPREVGADGVVLVVFVGHQNR